MATFATIESVAILKPQAVVMVEKFRRTVPKEKNANSLKNLEKATDYNGYLSTATAAKIKKMVDVWVTSVESVTQHQYKKQGIYFTFVTLTLPSPQQHPDNQIKNELLDPLIEWLRSPKGWAVKGYVWRAEAQKNGNIHFHLIVDKWICQKRLRQKWNQICNRLGYLDRYTQRQQEKHKNGFAIDPDQLAEQIRAMQDHAQKERKNLSYSAAKAEAIKRQKKAYELGKANGWTNPNSTDIKKIQNHWNVAAYVTKYISKRPKLKKLAKNQAIEADQYGNKYVVTYTEENGVKFESDRTPYKEEFETRKIEGRIWGRADALEAALLEYPQFVVSTTYIEKADDKYSDYEELERPDLASYITQQRNANKAEFDRINQQINSQYVKVIPLQDLQQHTLPADLKRLYLNHYKAVFQRLYA